MKNPFVISKRPLMFLIVIISLLLSSSLSFAYSFDVGFTNKFKTDQYTCLGGDYVPNTGTVQVSLKKGYSCAEGGAVFHDINCGNVGDLLLLTVPPGGSASFRCVLDSSPFDLEKSNCVRVRWCGQEDVIEYEILLREASSAVLSVMDKDRRELSGEQIQIAPGTDLLLYAGNSKTVPGTDITRSFLEYSDWPGQTVEISDLSMPVPRSYYDPGKYTIKFTLTDSYGYSASDEAKVYVVDSCLNLGGKCVCPAGGKCVGEKMDWASDCSETCCNCVSTDPGIPAPEYELTALSLSPAVEELEKDPSGSIFFVSSVKNTGEVPVAVPDALFYVDEVLACRIDGSVQMLSGEEKPLTCSPFNNQKYKDLLTDESLHRIKVVAGQKSRSLMVWLNPPGITCLQNGYKCGCPAGQWCKDEASFSGCDRVACCKTCAAPKVEVVYKEGKEMMDIEGVAGSPDYITFQYLLKDFPVGSVIKYKDPKHDVLLVFPTVKVVSSDRQAVEVKFRCKKEGATVITVGGIVGDRFFFRDQGVTCKAKEKSCSEHSDCTACARNGCYWCDSPTGSKCVDSCKNGACAGGKCEKTCQVTCPESCCSESGDILFDPVPWYKVELKQGFECADPYSGCGIHSWTGIKRICGLECLKSEGKCLFDEPLEQVVCSGEGEDCRTTDCCIGMTCDKATNACKKSECTPRMSSHDCGQRSEYPLNLVIHQDISEGMECSMIGERKCNDNKLYRCTELGWSVYQTCNPDFAGYCGVDKCVVTGCSTYSPQNAIGTYCPGSQVYTHVESCYYMSSDPLERIKCLESYVYAHTVRYAHGDECTCDRISENSWSPEAMISCYDSENNICSDGCGRCYHLAATLYSLLMTCGDYCGVNNDNLYTVGGQVLNKDKDEIGQHAWLLYNHPVYSWIFIDFPVKFRETDNGAFVRPEDHWCVLLTNIENMNGKIADKSLLETLSKRCKYYNSRGTKYYYEVACYGK